MSSESQYASTTAPGLETICFGDLRWKGEVECPTPSLFDTDLFRATVRVFVELQDNGGAYPEGTVGILVQEQPEIVAGFDTGEIEQLVVALLGAEVQRLSKHFDGIYREFNERYFAGRLPEYRVRVVFDIHTFANEPIYGGGVSTGLIRFEERCIYIRYTQWPMEETLIHEMAHAATNGEHGEEWLAEMRRLKEAGAPVADCELE